MLVGLDKASQYDVHADGNRVVINVEGASAPAARSSASVSAPTTQVASAEPKAEPAPAPAPNEPKSAEPAVAEPEAKQAGPIVLSDGSQEPNVVATQVDEQPVKHPAQKVTSMTFAKDTLVIRTDGQIGKYELIELANPPRLALDLYGVGMGTHSPKAQSAALQGIRVGKHGEKLRLVFDMKGSMTAYRAARTATGVQVSLGETKVAAAPVEAPAKAEDREVVAEIDGQKVKIDEAGSAAQPARAEAMPLPVKTEVAKAPGSLVEVKDVTFEDDPSGGRIELKLSGNARWKVERPDERSAVLTIESAKLPKRLERSLDTSALDTPVKMISAFSVAGATERVRLVVAGNGALDETVVKTPTGLAWRLSVKGVKTEEVSVNARTAGFASEPARYAEQGAPQRQRWVGKKVSFEFKDIELHNLLRIIAEVSKKNIVVADDVSGKVTIRLRNVPWDQAFDLILRSKQLGKEDLGNIVRVAPLKTLEEESKLREARKKSEKALEDLVVQLIPVNYATAGEMSTRVKDVLSERGTVSVDARTNTLIVRDVASNIGKARSLVQTLDTQTPQVLIESRIIEANTTFSKQVGVQWGGSSQFAPGTGNATGLTFPSTVAVRGGSTNEGTAGTSSTPDFAVNLPASVGTGAGGALGFVFGSAGGALALNLRLSAMENQGTVKTISAPKVTTLDNVAAKISQGVSVPFSQTSASGTSTSFIEARLSLEVTPHITQDGSILMIIKAENNQPDPSATGSNGQPAIQRKEANTQVLVKDGDTTVIGGIYVKRTSNSSASVPFFGRIPVLGWFFRNATDSESRTELLIFISPRIINRQTIAQNL